MSDEDQVAADRMAIEKVYYNHRLGAKPPFEEAMPAQLVRALIKTDLKKEALLKRVYGTEITPAMVKAEVERIDRTTRAPDVLSELKQALGNDPARFARAVARPIVVDRLLRDRFDNDESQHAGLRLRVTELRQRLLKAKNEGSSADGLASLMAGTERDAVRETTWQLTPPALPPQAKSSAGPFTVEASARPMEAQPKDGIAETNRQFADLPKELQQTLRAQLRQAGDVSAVIETASGFLLFVLKHRSEEEMRVVSVALPKCSLETWLAAQPD